MKTSSGRTRTWLVVAAGWVAGAMGAGWAGAAVPAVPVPPQNPITEAKRVLGKILFWEEQLSSSNTVSCGTCHSPGNGGADPRLAVNPHLDGIIGTPDDVQGSPGVLKSSAANDYVRDTVFGFSPQITPRAANVNIMAAYAPNLFWDGRATSQFVDPETGQVAIPTGGALESQAVGPIVSDVEMAHQSRSWSQVTAKLARVRPLALATSLPPDVAGVLASGPSYGDLFQAAFGDRAITARRIAFAIATYQRTLIANQTPFDAFRAGNTSAMTPGQVQGFNQFQLHNCSGCHSIVNDLFTDFTFRNIGLRPVGEDNGRQGVTGNATNRGQFKVPSLRNVGLKRTFMHNGQFTTLPQVLGFYARAPGAPVQFTDNRDPLMNAIVPLPPQDAGAIQDFLQNALTDPRVASQSFPFDRPTLFTNRPADQSTIVGGGVAGTGGIVPQLILNSPSMLGNLDYRVGLTGALGGATAHLEVSLAGPVNGVITPARTFAPLIASGSGAGNGVATQRWPLSYGQAQPGQVLFVQWVVDDPAAPGGKARSVVGRVPIFCGSAGCPGPCDAIDLDLDRGIDVNDLVMFLDAFEAGSTLADLDDDGDSAQNNPDGSVDINDLIFFLARFESGC